MFCYFTVFCNKEGLINVLVYLNMIYVGSKPRNSLSGGIYHATAVGGAAWPYSVGNIDVWLGNTFF